MFQHIAPRLHDLGNGVVVGRILPALPRRNVGPFVFLDRMGPAEFAAGNGLDVRPHPHIGLATLTYLFDGVIRHRDSVGSLQDIRPGDVNWMVAGRGIVHSERSPEALREAPHRLDGLQSWLALPQPHEETEPGFFHFPAAALPQRRFDGVIATILAGHAFGERAPVPVFSDTLYVDVLLEAGASLSLPEEHAERSVYLVEGEVRIDGEPVEPGHLVVLDPGTTPSLHAITRARVALLGGASLDGPRRLWWNFVSSSEARIEQAKQDWQAERFAPVPGEHERIPLPENR